MDLIDPETAYYRVEFWALKEELETWRSKLLLGEEEDGHFRTCGDPETTVTVARGGYSVLIDDKTLDSGFLEGFSLQSTVSSATTGFKVHAMP